MEQTVNERIKLLRNHLDVSQNEFALKIELTAAAISRIESKLVTPQLKTLKSIANSYGVSLKWLKNGTGEMFDTEAKFKEGKVFSWKEEAYEQLKQTNDFLKQELEYFKKLVSQMAGKPNFLKGIESGGIFKFLEENTFNTVSRV